MVIVSILASVVIPRYISLGERAKQKAIAAGIAELNGREILTWSNHKISTTGWDGDDKLNCPGEDPCVNYNLGLDYTLDAPPHTNPVSITFKATTVNLDRTESTNEQPGSWAR